MSYLFIELEDSSGATGPFLILDPGVNRFDGAVVSVEYTQRTTSLALED